ncbi:hypothetical protein [Jannaschia aquimarina]|uniref:Uncharacterized protein n=1 Tax=Jannaschia aquimarina TaxID=935700 RepID=A0A0D1E9S2_9RHOB|nr:hypothetical protein [Jannaschia aquimarina]KIT14439.1 hypothetical protein jaqu_37270 [Jannaschia aquimarina]SNT29345.1 hypothetical protein SAMN05421775_11072 [Jannaschia aquimarina]
MSFIGSILGSPPPQSTNPNPPPPSDPGDGGSTTDGPPPVEETGQTDGSNQTDTGGQDNGGSATNGGSLAAGDVKGPTPYLARPTIDETAVAEAAQRASRLDEAFEIRSDEDVARQLAEAAQDREAAKTLIASIQPPPENAPSLPGDARAIRNAEPEPRDPARAG